MDNYKELIERLRTESLYKDKATLEIMDLCMEAADVIAALSEENAQLRAEANHMQSYNADAEKVIENLCAQLEQVKRERDAAVAHLRTYQVFVNSCAFCKHDHDCDKQGPGRKSVEECWEWRGPQKEE